MLRALKKGFTKRKKEVAKVVWMTTEMAADFDREYYLLTTARETIIFAIFLINLTIISLGMISPSMFFLTQVMKQQFTERAFRAETTEIKFQDIKCASDFWAFVENNLVNGLYSDYWYDKTAPIKETSLTDKGILYENKLIALPRIRQVKVRNDSCVIHPNFKRTFLECFGPYDQSTKETKAYGTRSGTEWTHSEFTTSTSITGKVATYDGGGYYKILSREANETKEILDKLKQNLWITRGTRAIFIDFNTYNANVNLFCVTKLLFEFPPTGGVIPTGYFYAVKLLRYVTIHDHMLLGFEFVQLALTLYYLAEELREIIFEKLGYFTKFWSIIDQAIIWTYIAYVVMSVRQYIVVSNILNIIVKEPDKYYSFFTYGVNQLNTRYTKAITLFLVYMKIFKYLSFNRTMGQLNNTLRKCAKDILSFSVMFLLIFISFAQLGYLIFGSQVTDFSTFGVAMFTLLRTILGDFNYSEIEKAHRVLAPLYFLLFIFLVFFVLLNMFLAIINDTYTEVKTEMAIAPDEMQMAEFLKRGCYNFMRKSGCKKCVRPITVMKNEYNATSEQIRGALKRCGFSDMDVDMFFARYNIDPNAVIDEKDIMNLVNDLLGKTEEEQSRKIDVPLVKLEDFVAQQDRLDNIEKVMAEIAEKLDNLLQKLKKSESPVRR